MKNTAEIPLLGARVDRAQRSDFLQALLPYTMITFRHLRVLGGGGGCRLFASMIGKPRKENA